MTPERGPRSGGGRSRARPGWRRGQDPSKNKVSIFLIIGYFSVLVLIFVAALVVLNSMRSKGSIARALNMSLFLITLPRENHSANQNQKPEKELIGVMEQLFSSFTNIHAKGWNKFIYGEPYIALELAVPTGSQEIHFYAAVPRSFQEIFQKQVHGLFPAAELAPVQDYSIFHTHGAAVAASVRLKNYPILPLKNSSVEVFLK